jgi:invasion protein IalB
VATLWLAQVALKNIQELLLTVEFSVNLGTGFHAGKTTVPCLRSLTDVFQLKIHWAEVPRVRKQTNFSVVCCVVRAVDKFYFRLVTNETPNK